MVNLAELNLCFIAGTLGQGGAERQLFYLLKALRGAGASPSLLTLTQGEFWESRIRELGVPVTWVGQADSRLSRLKRIIRELQQIAAQSKTPMILQSQHFYTNIYAAAAARTLGLREIGAMRCDGFSEVQAHGRLLGNLSLKMPRVMAANSRAAIQFAIRAGRSGSQLFFLPNAIESDLFKTQPKLVSNVVRLLAAGRLEEQKRVDRFLRTLAVVRQQTDQQIKVIIAGDGALRSQLEQQTRDLNLADIVEFRGLVRDMASLYREADIFVLTSDWEGTPNVLLEAMASGLAVLSTNVGGVPDIVTHGQTGLLVAPQNEAELAVQMLELVENFALRRGLGWRAQTHVESNHSLNRLPHFLSNLYELALS